MREEALLEIQPDALDRVQFGRVEPALAKAGAGSGTNVMFAGMTRAAEPCQPA